MRCPSCGLQYDAFRTGLTFRDVFALLWSGSDDPKTWRYKRRHTVLGLWHQIKLEMWNEHKRECAWEEAGDECPF